ncbi:hypothetical protein GOBAR_DD13484 [Gossypium barbadense]|nr:hypothetical protein GOBAR_DD13484 [Gossypium barbadense]
MAINTQSARLQHLKTFQVIESINHRASFLVTSYIVDLRNRRYNCGRFQTFQYPCSHVVVIYAWVNIDYDQYIDEGYVAYPKVDCMIRNDINLREKGELKHYGPCRTVSRG